MGKIKKIYRSYQDLKKNPRKKALADLGLWLVFFLGMYIFFLILSNMGSSHTYHSFKQQDTLSNFKEMESYTFQMTGNQEQVTGMYVDEKMYIEYQGKTYFYKEGTIYQVDTVEEQLIPTKETLLSFFVQDLKPTILSQWLEASKVLEETKYNGKKKETLYQYSFDDKKMNLKVVEEDYQIKTIAMDGKDYLAKKGLQYDTFPITIQYQDVNEIQSASKNYENYPIKEESHADD